MNGDFGPFMDATIAPYTVSFIRVDSQSPRPIGSGTLAKAGQVRGILTCAHVVEEIEKEKEIGICLFPVRSVTHQRIKINVSELLIDAVILFDKPASERGRDIAFIRLPEDNIGDIVSVSSIVNLERGEAKTLDTLGTMNKSFDVVAGAVESLSREMRVEDGIGHLTVQGLMNVGQIASQIKIFDYDLLTFQPQTENASIVPRTYGGTSGGGIWRVYVSTAEDGTLNPLSPILFGVAFWETEPPNRDLIGHGPKSIYKMLLNAIRNRWDN